MLRRRVRYRVDGDSMRPTLSPGDFVLVDPLAFKDQPPRLGDVVIARHPYRAQMLIKRVSEIVDDGVILIGDQPEASSDSRGFGRIAFSAIIGQVTSRIS